MEKTYKYRFSRRAIYWTLVYLVVFVLLGWLLYHLYEGGYLSAWFTSFIVALIALMSLSIPRRIVVTDEKVEVRCLLDITEIRRDEIGPRFAGSSPRQVEMVLSGIRGLRVLRLLRTFPRPQAVRTRKTLRLGVEKLRGDHRHLRRPPVRLVFGCRPPRGGAYAPGGNRRRKTTKRKSRRNSIGIRPKSRQKTPGDCVFPENDLIFATEAGTARKNEK